MFFKLRAQEGAGVPAGRVSSATAQLGLVCFGLILAPNAAGDVRPAPITPRSRGSRSLHPCPLWAPACKAISKRTKKSVFQAMKLSVLNADSTVTPCSAVLRLDS